MPWAIEHELLGVASPALEEQRSRHLARRVAPELLRYGFNVDNFHGGPFLLADGQLMPPAAVDPRMIYGLTQPSIAGFLAQDDLRGRQTMTALLRRCAALALDEAAEFRLDALLSGEPARAPARPGG